MLLAAQWRQYGQSTAQAGADSKNRNADPQARRWRLVCAYPMVVAIAIDYAKFRSRSHDAVIRVYGDVGNVIETHEHAGEFREPWALRVKKPPRAEAWRLIVKWCLFCWGGAALGIVDHLRRRAIRLDLRAHLL